MTAPSARTFVAMLLLVSGCATAQPSPASPSLALAPGSVRELNQALFGAMVDLVWADGSTVRRVRAVTVVSDSVRYLARDAFGQVEVRPFADLQRIDASQPDRGRRAVLAGALLGGALAMQVLEARRSGVLDSVVSAGFVAAAAAGGALLGRRLGRRAADRQGWVLYERGRSGF